MKFKIKELYPIGTVKTIVVKGDKGDAGVPTDAQVEAAVDEWLEAHPEATTTVQDGAISYAKLDSSLKATADDVSDLKSSFEHFTPGLSDDAKQALLSCFQKVVWTNDDSYTYYDALHMALYPPTGIIINPSSLTMPLGDTAQLTATVLPASASQKVTWASSNSNVATVNSDGLVTAKADGRCKITASIGTVSTSCVVNAGEQALYPLESATNVTWGDRYNTAGYSMNLSVSDGNHIKLTSDASGSNWYDGANLSSLATNGINGRAVSGTWFTVQQGSTVTCKVQNVVLGNNAETWSNNKPRIYLIDADDTSVLSGSIDVRPGPLTNGEATKTVTASESVNVTALVLCYAPNVNFDSVEFDVSLYIDGRRYI